MRMLASVSDAVATDLGIAEIEKSALMSLVFVGFLIGNFSGGIAAGRGSPVLWSYAGMLVFSIGSAIATNLSLVFLVRGLRAGLRASGNHGPLLPRSCNRSFVRLCSVGSACGSFC